MTLQQTWDMTEEAYVLTSLFGHNENSSTGGTPKNSAVPAQLDEGFHGDDRAGWPTDQSTALGNEKTLEEYSQTFPRYRIKTAAELGFNTPDGRTISPPYKAELEAPSELSPVTREGGPGETGSLIVQLMDQYDGSQEFRDAIQNGPLVDDEIVTVPDGTGGEVEGVRASIIFGGTDPYLTDMKNDYALAEILTGNIAGGIIHYWISIAAFYSFLDFVLMADGTKLARVWDASYFPAHSLYVGNEWRDERPFREGIEWTRDGANPAFDTFALESIRIGRTPFDTFGTFLYKEWFDNGAGEHPVMDFGVNGSIITSADVESEYPSPLFPF